MITWKWTTLRQCSEHIDNVTDKVTEKRRTSGNLSRTSLIFSPFWPMIVRWNF